MKNMTMKRPVIIAIVCGVLTALFVGVYLSGLETTYKRGAEKVSVLVTTAYIDQGTMLDETLVQQRMVPKEYLQPRAIRAISDISSKDGRRLYMALVPLEKGEQIVATKLSLLGAETGISSVVPTDRRAVTILIDSALVDGIIKPGNRVDVISIFQLEDKDHRASEGAYTVLQNILVLAAGRDMLGMPPPRTEGQAAPAATLMETGMVPVSFSVTPQEAAMLVLAAERGTVRLSLRPAGDDKPAVVSAVRLQDIDKNITPAANPPQAPGRPSADGTRARQDEAMEILKKYQQKP